MGLFDHSILSASSVNTVFTSRKASSPRQWAL